MTANYSQTRQIFLSLAGNRMINFWMLFICAVFGGLPLLFHLLSNPVTDADPKALIPLVLPFQPLLSCGYIPQKCKEG